jgi:hypothetical protein
MKTFHLAGLIKPRLIRSPLFFLLLVIATAAYGGVPSMNVIVSDSSGKVAFRGATNADAAFSTANLAPGNYVVQFKSTSQTLRGNQYLLVVAAGGKKVIADAVPGEKFNGGGVAMRVPVGSGLRITGQVAPDQVVASSGAKIKVIDGKRYVWVKTRTGSNLADHWEEEGVAAARIVATMSIDKVRRIQDASFEGSMLDRYHSGPYEVRTHY